MAQAQLIVVGHLTLPNKAIRDHLIQAIGACAAWAEKNEPKTTKYALLLPRDPTDETSLYVIEEYTDQAAFELHCAAPPCQAVIEFISQPSNLAAPLDSVQTSPVRTVSRASVLDRQDPFVVWAALDYAPETFEEAAQGWAGVVENTERTEPQTPVYMCLKDRAVENRVRMLEIYDSEEAFKAHCQTSFVQKRIEVDAKLRKGTPEVVFLRKIGGYLYKQRSSI